MIYIQFDVIGVILKRTAFQKEGRISDVLGNWAASERPLYRALAEAFQSAVRGGDLLPGTRLPAERVLARQLAVSRSTVIAAFVLLKSEGWLEGRQGSGTWVRLPGDDARFLATGDDPAASLRANAFLRPGPDAPIDLATAALPAASEVIEAVRSLPEHELRAITAGHGYLSRGLPELRSAIAADLSEQGVPTGESQVLVTTGTQQGLSLIAALCVRSGGSALVENPTSPGALDVLRSVNADLKSVPLDEHGPRMAVLEDLMIRLSPRLVYVVPTFQNPTGAVMPAANRRHLAELADKLQIVVVEDLSHSFVGFGTDPPPPIAHFGANHVVTLGSMSKLFWGGLRIGWIRAPEHLIARLTRLKAAADLGTPLISQLVCAKLLPQSEAVRAQRRRYLLPRLELVGELLHELLPSWEWRRPPGGLSLWIKLPHGNAGEFGQLAYRYGVVFVAGRLLSADEGHQDHLRLSFGLGLGSLEDGMRRLGEAWRSYKFNA